VKPHNRITLIPNRYRAGALREFRAFVVDYFERSQRDPDGVPFDWEGAQAARSRIHQMLPRVIQMVGAAGLGGWAVGSTDTDPGAALGRVEVLTRIFSAQYPDGLEQEVLDVLDMALGVYDGDRIVAAFRAVNPFHYAGTIVEWLMRAPRRLLTTVGLRRARTARIQPQDLVRLEAAVARLTDVEEFIESRFAELQHRQAGHQGDQARQLADLAERLDFAERILAKQRPQDRLPAPEGRAFITPV